MLLAAKVKVLLIDMKPDIEVVAENGTVSIKAKYTHFKNGKMIHKIEEIAKSVPGVRSVEVIFNLLIYEIKVEKSQFGKRAG